MKRRTLLAGSAALAPARSGLPGRRPRRRDPDRLVARDDRGARRAR